MNESVPCESETGALCLRGWLCRQPSGEGGQSGGLERTWWIFAG